MGHGTMNRLTAMITFSFGPSCIHFLIKETYPPVDPLTEVEPPAVYMYRVYSMYRVYMGYTGFIGSVYAIIGTE